VDNFNSAQRLYEIISYLRGKSNTPGLQLGQAYLEYFNDLGDPSDALIYANQLAKLAKDVENIIKSNEAINDFQLAHLHPIFNFCRNLNLTVRLSIETSKISDTSMLALQTYTHLFSTISNESKVDDTVLSALKDDIDELENEINSGVENLELKKVLLGIIEAARYCLASYKIQGNKSFTLAFETMLGKIIIEYEKNPTSQNSSLKKIYNFIIKFGALAGAINETSSLSSNISKSLGFSE